jgi:glucose/arabinose dehydrogenase
MRVTRFLLSLLVGMMLAACSDAAAAPTSGPAEATAIPAVNITVPPPKTTAADEPIPAATQAASTEASPTTAVSAEATPAEAAPSVSVFPDPASAAWQPVVEGLTNPIVVEHAADGSGRLFILEQPGRIRILRSDELLPTPFLDITDRVGKVGMEQGLLGLAFHPQYTKNGFLYVNYTDLNGDTVIARFSVLGDDPDQADPASEMQLLSVKQPYANHNGGVVKFGPDGYLYLGLGDGGSAGDPQNNAQSLQSLLGKILRLDVDGGQPYAIPADNPFSPPARPEIWAYGLRNPWRFIFDRANGDLFIADVGQNEWEEIDYLAAGSAGGQNFGWRYFEATHPYDGKPPADAVMVAPVAEYSHSEGCSVSGGLVYRGRALPAFQGVYLYGDFCTGTVWGLLRNAAGQWQSQVLYQGLRQITALGEDEAGEPYLVDRSGKILRLEAR